MEKKEKPFFEEIFTLSSLKDLGLSKKNPFSSETIEAECSFYFGFIVGLFDRRATFHLDRSDNLVGIRPVLYVRNYSYTILEDVQKFFSFGKKIPIGRIEYRELTNKYVLIIDNIDDLKERIIPFFSRFKLDVEQKQKQFDVFTKVLNEITENKKYLKI